MFLAKDGGPMFKPIEGAVGASGVSRHVQDVGWECGVWVAACGYRRGRGRRGGRKKGGEGVEEKQGSHLGETAVLEKPKSFMTVEFQIQKWR